MLCFMWPNVTGGGLGYSWTMRAIHMLCFMCPSVTGGGGCKSFWCVLLN